MDDVGLAEALCDIADLSLQGQEDVAVVRQRVPVVQHGCAGLHREHRVEDRRQDLVLHLERAARGLGRALGLRDHGGQALAREAHDIVEQQDVVGVDQMVLVKR